MRFDFDDYSGMDNSASIPLLISERSQGLILAAIAYLQHEFAWDTTDDFNVIDEAVSNAISEVILETMPDFTPVGTVMAWVGEIADIPAKWLRCDGSFCDGDDFPELLAVIADIFKDGFGNFNLPEMDDRFLFGSGINDDVGELGGENQHILTTAEMPSHQHTINSLNSTGGTTDRVSRGGASGTLQLQNTSSVGGGAAHNNMPAYIAVHWIIKALP